MVTGAKGRGSNLRALYAAFPNDVRRVIAPSDATPAAEFAREQGLDLRVVTREEEWPAALAGSELVVLAGITRLYPESALAVAPAINVHPALLPRFGGRGMYGIRVHEAVIAAGEPESGCTVHRVTAEYDEGPPLVQLRCPVEPGDTPESLAARVLALEHRALIQAVGEIIGVAPA